MGKSSPAPPPAPDPAATAAAQTEANKTSAIAQANLNRINQVTPQGSLSYSQDKNQDGSLKFNSDGTPVYTQSMTYSPDEQAKYEQANKVALGLDGLAVNNIDRVTQAQATPFTYDGMTALQTGIGANNPYQMQNGPQIGAMAYSADPSKQLQTNAAPYATGGAGQGVQTGLDYSHLTALPGTNDFGAEQQRTANTVYQQAASRLDPQWSQNDSDLKAQLAAQGISEDSDAYRRAYDNESRAKNDAYNQATYSAQQAGSAEQSRLFGLALTARQQGQNEADTQGTFGNSAQGQIFGQKLSANDQNFNQSLQANSQNFSQNSSDAQLMNSAEAQAFGQGTSNATLNNQNQNQYFNQDSAAATFNNQARQQQIQEAAYLRNIPLNDIASLLGTGGGVNGPTFNPVSQVGVAAPDYQGLVSSNYNQAVSQYNTQQQARSQMLGSIFGAAGSMGAAFLSDMRFKENIKRIGTLANGIATYAFNYIGDKAQQFGVMAQEVMHVIPEAVVQGPNGVLYVNYGKVY